MSSAAHYHPHYTLADYESWEGDWELWQGTPVAMSPSANFRHQVVSREITTRLIVALEEAGCTDCQVVYELDWRISADTVVRPDISLVCGEVKTKFLETAPKLIVEILSPSTADKDRTAKHGLYEQEQVGYYLIADPEANTLEAWQLESDKYSRLERVGNVGFDLAADCSIRPDFSEIFN